MKGGQPDLAALLLPGAPVERIRRALDRAAGGELASGKFASPESSSALAVNGFGPFLDAPDTMPHFPCLADLDWPAIRVDVERQMRFPWSGGRHPWLDAAFETTTHLVGVESKRFEPFRDHKEAKLSDAYWRDVWGDGMERWCAMRDRLRAEPIAFAHLDAAQLVKHAFGLASEATRISKIPVLLYMFAEPTSGRPVTPEQLARHRAEIAYFAEQVEGARVRFASCSWREWLSGFESPAKDHADRIMERFCL